MRFTRHLLGIAGLLSLISSPLHADTMEIIALADATVESNGVNGQEILPDAESIQTSMSGGSNIRDGLYEFDLSAIPAGATVESATLQLRTSQIITNTNGNSPVEFFAFTGNGVLEISDQGAAATSFAMEVFATGTPANTDIEIEFDSVAILNNILTDGNSDSFMTVRSETENFVLFRVHSLEATDSAAVPATLVVTYSGGVLLGDVNLDCNVNLLDVDPFITAISTGAYIAQADINEDGMVDLLDVAPFVELLAGN